jgi:hypothetical protein
MFEDDPNAESFDSCGSVSRLETQMQTNNETYLSLLGMRSELPGMNRSTIYARKRRQKQQPSMPKLTSLAY